MTEVENHPAEQPATETAQPAAEQTVQVQQYPQLTETTVGATNDQPNPEAVNEATQQAEGQSNDASSNDVAPPKSVEEILTEYALGKWADLRKNHTYLSAEDHKKTVISELEAHVKEHDMPLGDLDLLVIAEKTRTVDQNAV